jgi:hypothetical protein
MGLIQPSKACETCWHAWLNARPRKALGYCWHGHIAWRIRSSGELITVAGIDPAEHLAMVRELQKREPPGYLDQITSRREKKWHDQLGPQ